MNTSISQAQIEEYRQNGFVVIEDFLTPSELERWRATFDAALADRQNKRLPDGRWDAGEVADTGYESIFQQRLNLWRDQPAMRELILSPDIGRMATELAGVDGLRCWHDQALVKPPWGAPTSWHLDNPYWSFYDARSISIWIALDDATPHNGCLYFLPGSHKTADFNRNATIQVDRMSDLFAVYPEWNAIEATCGAMPAGSCSFHTGVTAHAAQANMTPGSRRAMTCAFMPLGSRFNGQQNVLPDDYFKSLKEGDELCNDDWNPIVYQA